MQSCGFWHHGDAGNRPHKVSLCCILEIKRSMKDGMSFERVPTQVMCARQGALVLPTSFGRTHGAGTWGRWRAWLMVASAAATAGPRCTASVRFIDAPHLPVHLEGEEQQDVHESSGGNSRAVPEGGAWGGVGSGRLQDARCCLHDLVAKHLWYVISPVQIQ